MVNKRQAYINLGSYDNKRNKDGRKLCLNCEKPITKKRRTRYCSDKCSTEFLLKNSHQALRSKLIKECFGVCAKCKKIPIRFMENKWLHKDGVKMFKEEMYRWYKVINFNKNSAIIVDDSRLILDHIKPIAIGGEEFNQDNLQILCVECSKEKTKEDAKNIAQLRRGEKMESVGQITLPSATLPTM